MLSAPFEFRRQSFTITPPAEFGLKLGSHEPAVCQAVFVAMRPQFVQPIYEKIVYIGQTKPQGPYKRFSQLKHLEFSPKVPEEMSDTLQIIDPSDEISATRVPTNASFTDSFDIIEPFIITGPRHVGKSHIMLQVAARLACEPGVVVAHIGNSQELLLDDSEHDRAKYISFIEHIVGAFNNYSFITSIVDRWYIDTNMGTVEPKMRDATTDFMISLYKQCRLSDITLVFFLEHCEKVMYAMPFQTIVSISDLQNSFGAIVVMSSSDPIRLRFKEPIQSYQCVISGPLNLTDAKNVCINSIRRMAITSSELSKLLTSVEYHPLDVASIVQTFEAHMSDNQGNTQSLEACRRASIQYAITDQRQARRTRITEMHLWFLQHAMANAASRLDSKLIRRIDRRQTVIDTNSTELLTEKREIMRCIFILYHALELKPGATRDTQFMVPESNSTSRSGDFQNNNACSAARYATKCHPPVSQDIMYNIHFQGTVTEQFGWLFETKNRYDVETRIRQRYFDMLLLEQGCFCGIVRNPLTMKDSVENMPFVFANSAFDTVGLEGVDTRWCTTFEEALSVVRQYIVSTQDLGPEYLPRKDQTSLKNTVMFYFPRLGLNEEWIGTMRSVTHFQGSFMAAVSRIDMFSEQNKSHMCGYTGCRYVITWISTDPIYVDKTVSEVVHPVTAAIQSKMNTEAPVAEICEQVPRDAIDFDDEHGSALSWSAKAIRLFPEIRKRTLDLGFSPSLLGRVRLLVLTAEKRYQALVSGKERPLEKLVNLKDYSEFIDDIAIASTATNSFKPEVRIHI
ncbi:hypothetical protein GGH15_004084 [Coemansia sp. RSA 562]|nr:hypothetical protein GGH15_004084 [Coemansia sp. RSA 562]